MAPGNASDSFGTCDRLTVDDTAHQIYRLDRVDGSARLPYQPEDIAEEPAARRGRSPGDHHVRPFGPRVRCCSCAGFVWAR